MLYRVLERSVVVFRANERQLNEELSESNCALPRLPPIVYLELFVSKLALGFKKASVLRSSTSTSPFPPLIMPDKLFHCVTRLNHHTQAIMAISISPDATMVLTGGK
jgi:hypothetical protein